MRVLALLFATGLAAACGDALLNNAADASEPPAADLPAGAVVFGEREVPALLRQCSREAPARGDGSWQPVAADILALEAALPAELAAHRFPRVDWSQWPQGWRRQYVGIVRHGRRYIYGNFIPISADHDGRAGTVPMIICDGGAVFFGAEYDVAARRFSHLAFNGAV